jgi:hypothetical protein
MNDTELQSSPITLDRRLLLGETDYQVTAFPTDDRRIELCIVSSDGDGQVVSEISGGIAPADLTGLTDVLTSTLAGLIAMTQPPFSSRTPPVPGQRGRSPNQGARWTPEDDARLVARYRAGARPRELMEEFGRSNGGIRARLEYLGELAPGARWRPPPPAAPTPSAPSPTPADDAGSAPPTPETSFTAYPGSMAATADPGSAPQTTDPDLTPPDNGPGVTGPTDDPGFASTTPPSVVPARPTAAQALPDVTERDGPTEANAMT